MRHIQYLPRKLEKRWVSSDMDSRFTTALEAGKVVDELRRQLYSINYNSDLRKLLKNIDKQIAELSSAEVIARQTHKTRALEQPLENLHKSIDYLEKLIIIAKLSE